MQIPTGMFDPRNTGMLASQTTASLGLRQATMKICTKCNGSFEEGIVYCPNDGARLTTVSKLQLAGQQVPAEAAEAAQQRAIQEGVEDLTGRTIAGRYNIVRRLGEGGMGVVYQAIDTRLEKPVAIKVLREDFAHRSDVVARFTQEAKSAARIKHENVLDVTDYGQTEDGSFYIAMELLVGTDLADVLQKEGTVAVDRAIAIMIQVTRALAAAHSKGIVHRDLKPENIFLVKADDGREIVKIVDFGIAQMKDLSESGGGKKLTRTGMIFGTPEYMSPEQAAGKPIDHRVDIYAVGVILYEMFAGRVPFVGDTFMGVLTQHLFEQPPPIRSLRPDADVTPEIEAIINKALAKNPADRYQTMQELTEDLMRVRDGLRPVAASAVDTTSRVHVGSVGMAMTVPIAPSTQGGTVTPQATVIERPSTPSRKGLVAVAGLGVITVVLAGVALARSSGNQGGNSRESTVSTRSHQEVRTAATTTEDRTQETANRASTGQNTTGTPGNHAAPTAVRVRIATTPVPARIEVEGQAGLSCNQTPCELTLPRGTSVHLLASAPRKRGELVFTPERDGQEVTVSLVAMAGGSSRSSSGRDGAGRLSSDGRQGQSNPRCRPGQLQWFDRREMIYRPCTN